MHSYIVIVIELSIDIVLDFTIPNCYKKTQYHAYIKTPITIQKACSIFIVSYLIIIIASCYHFANHFTFPNKKCDRPYIRLLNAIIQCVFLLLVKKFIRLVYLIQGVLTRFRNHEGNLIS